MTTVCTIILLPGNKSCHALKVVSKAISMYIMDIIVRINSAFRLNTKINERSYSYDEFKKQEVFMVCWWNFIGSYMEKKETTKSKSGLIFK